MAANPSEIISEWGVTAAGFKEFVASRMKEFSLPKTMYDVYVDSSTGIYDEIAAFSAAAWLAINVALASKKILNTTGFVGKMLPNDFEWIKAYVYLLTAFFSTNDTLRENITGTQVNTPNYSFQIDTTRNIIDNDVIGTYARVAMKNSQIDQYKLVEDGTLSAVIQNTSGTITIVNHIDEEALKEQFKEIL